MVKIEDDLEFKLLQEKAPSVKVFVLLCSNYDCTRHFTKNTTKWQDDMNHEWLLNLTCTVCNATWSICYHCNKTKTKFVNTKQINMHKLTYHGKKRKKNNIETINLVQKHQKTKTNSNITETIADDKLSTNKNDNDSLITYQVKFIIVYYIFFFFIFICYFTGERYYDCI